MYFLYNFHSNWSQMHQTKQSSGVYITNAIVQQLDASILNLVSAIQTNFLLNNTSVLN